MLKIHSKLFIIKDGKNLYMVSKRLIFVKKSVSCEKVEIYNDVEILVRLSSLESSVLKLSSVCEKLCGEVLELKKGMGRVRRGGGKKVVVLENIKQKKMSEYFWKVM